MKINPKTKFEGLTRYLMVHLLSESLPLYIVNEHPKSGGTWLGQMLGEALDIPFPRNTLPVLRSSIMHGHYMNDWGMQNVVVIWRDGRDVISSWYHHCLIESDNNLNKSLVDQMRFKLNIKDSNDVKKNLPRFIEFCFTVQPPIRFSWTQFVHQWYGKSNVVYTTYENLKSNCAQELIDIVKKISNEDLSSELAFAIEDKFSFINQISREPGHENKSQFLRKGIVGDWKNNFTKESCEIFDHYAGKELIMLGYETNNSWINKNHY